MIDILHSRGPYACGDVAFHCRHRPAPGTEMKVSDIVLLDLTEPVAGTIIVCGSCGRTDDAGAFIPADGWSATDFYR